MNRRDALKVFAGSVAATVCAGEAVASDVVMENDVLVLSVPRGGDRLEQLHETLIQAFPKLKGRLLLVDGSAVDVDVVKERV